MKPLLWGLVALVFLYSVADAQFPYKARWCTINVLEENKCKGLLEAIKNRPATVSSNVVPSTKDYTALPELQCVRGATRFDCMKKISDNQADLMALDPGMGYTAGEFYTMMPLMAEKYTVGNPGSGLTYYAVAVVRKSNRDININNLKGKKTCHPGVGRAAGWVYPVSKLIQESIMPITECNVPVKSAAAYFGAMCAPGGLARYYNPFGNNPQTICKNCQGESLVYCTDNDPFAGYQGAFRCMASGAGDVAFVRDSTILEYTSNTTVDRPDDFELLCPDGTRRSYADAATCNWGSVPSHIVMTSAIHNLAQRNTFKELLKKISSDFGESGSHKDLFDLFASSAYGGSNLMFTDDTKELVDVGSRDSYYTWVGEEYRKKLQVLNTCPVRQARWCVISSYEMKKCERMIMAFDAKNLKPELNCILGTGVRDCMDKINSGDADLISLDASDVYTAGKYYNLVPIASEDYSGIQGANYYAVAVARRTDSHLTIFNLKSRRSCHSGVMTAAGWVVPVDKLIETVQIRVPDCNVYHYVGEFFSKSCVPGVLNNNYNKDGTNPINLCEACASGGRDRCSRNDRELYYGNSGSFRCLTEYGGDVAFMKHTTVRENTDGRNLAEWARNRRSDDYELLCNDGTRKNIDSWENCNMGKIPPNAIVTAGFKSEREREIYWTLLNYAQQFFASDSNENFPMFTSLLDHKDLIFQDSTVRLVHVEKEKQSYDKYLGSSFMRAMQRMESIDCVTGGASGNRLVSPIVLLSLVAVFFSVVM